MMTLIDKHYTIEAFRAVSRDAQSKEYELKILCWEKLPSLPRRKHSSLLKKALSSLTKEGRWKCNVGGGATKMMGLKERAFHPKVSISLEELATALPAILQKTSTLILKKSGRGGLI